MDPTNMGMTGMLSPQQRMMMAQALSQGGGGQDQFAGLRQALMMRQMQQPQSQMMSPGTMANGGWQTSVEGGGAPGLLSRLGGMFSGGGY